MVSFGKPSPFAFEHILFEHALTATGEIGDPDERASPLVKEAAVEAFAKADRAADAERLRGDLKRKIDYMRTCVSGNRARLNAI
jgi:hypothetical protein